MRRLAYLVTTISLCAIGAVTCATYKDDLERSRGHYQGSSIDAARKEYEENQYERALALLRVLEHDIDSYSPGEQAQYAYLRGMTDYRLSQSSRLTSQSQEGSSVANPKLMYRMNSRHWLGVAAATEKLTPGGLTPDEKQRLTEAMNDLNKDVYGADEVPLAEGADGGAGDAGESAAPAGEPPAAPPAAAPAAPPAAPPAK
jgi:hypothetical protein